MEPEVSVILSTYNRCEILGAAIESLMAQDTHGREYEVIVVDNNSTDQTKSVIERLREEHQDKLKYCFEPNQGVSNARNKGISLAKGRIIAFIDDDIRATPDWISSIIRAFDSFPDADCVGGKVLPESNTKFPNWLTADHWSAMAFLDLGQKPMCLDVQNGPGLIGANLAIRASVFNEIGWFSPKLQRVKDTIGSMEDHEYQLRLDKAFKRIFYIPEIVVHTHVFPERLTKTYHRRWHFGHGGFYALMKLPDFETSKVTILNVPGHVYRGVISNVYRWMKYRMAKKPVLEFQSELEIQFLLGFLRKRFAERGIQSSGLKE